MELLHQLGIDWRLLLSQAANFALLLIILRIAVYKPVLAMLRTRREHIKESMVKAAEAERRLQDANETVKEKMKAADAEALAMLRATEARAQELETKLVGEARAEQAAILETTDTILRTKTEAAKQVLRERAAELVKAGIIKTVELSPAAVDEALIKKAMERLNA